jgi:hypothetical protein
VFHVQHAVRELVGDATRYSRAERTAMAAIAVTMHRARSTPAHLHDCPFRGPVGYFAPR